MKKIFETFFELLESWTTFHSPFDGFEIVFPQNTTVLITDESYKTMSQDRKMYKCTCADCGKESEVPFDPKPGKPVYCRECLPKHRSRRF